MGSCTSLKERLAAPFYCRKKPRYDAYIVSYQGKLGYHYFRDLQGITFFQILIQKLSLDQPLAADPEYQLAIIFLTIAGSFYNAASQEKDSHRQDTTASLTGTSLCTYAIEPPCTEPYARWCERSGLTAPPNRFIVHPNTPGLHKRPVERAQWPYFTTGLSERSASGGSPLSTYRPGLRRQRRLRQRRDRACQPPGTRWSARRRRHLRR